MHRYSHHEVPVPRRPARGVRGLLRAAPGGLPVSGALLREERLSTANGPKRCPAHLTVPAAAVSEAQRRAERHAGTVRLGPPRRGRTSLRPAAATASRPRLQTFDQTPLANEGGCGDYKPRNIRRQGRKLAVGMAGRRS